MCLTLFRTIKMMQENGYRITEYNGVFFLKCHRIPQRTMEAMFARNRLVEHKWGGLALRPEGPTPRKKTTPTPKP